MSGAWPGQSSTAGGWTTWGPQTPVPNTVCPSMWTSQHAGLVAAGFVTWWTRLQVYLSPKRGKWMSIVFCDPSQPHKSHSVTSNALFLWKQSRVLPKLQGRRYTALFLMGRVSKNLQMCFETSTELQFLHISNETIMLLELDHLGQMAEGRINRANADELLW